MTDSASKSVDQLEIVLLHSPLVGSASLEPTREELVRRGYRALLPSPYPDVIPAWRDWPQSLLSQLPILKNPVFIGHSMASLLAARLASEYDGSGMICLDGDIPRERGETTPVADSFRPIIDGLPQSDGKLPPWHQWWATDPFEGWKASDEAKFRITADIPQLHHSWFDDHFHMPDWSHAKVGFIRLGAWFDAEGDRAEKLGWPVIRIKGIHLHPAVAPKETADAIIDCLFAMGLSTP